MGVSLAVYSIDYPSFTKLLGSRDAQLFADIQEAHSQELDDEDEPMNAREREDSEPTTREALAELIEGETLDPHFPGVYHSALKLLINHSAQMLESQEREDLGDCWELDMVLRKHGFPPKFLKRESCGNLPMPIPEFVFDDGLYFSPEIIQAVVKDLRPINILGVRPDLARRVIRLNSWVKSAAEQNRGLLFVWD